MTTGAMVLALARSGDIAGAIAAGEAALEGASEDAGLAMFVGMLNCRQGALHQGIKWLEHAVDIAPGQLPPRVELARALLSVGRYEDAESQAGRLADMGSAVGREMLRVRGQALVQLQRNDEAVLLFEQLVNVDAADFESWRGLGLARLALGDAETAVAALEHAARLQPRSGGIWLDLARAQNAAQASDAAERAARHAVTLLPADFAARIELARSLAAVRRLDEALAELAVARLMDGIDSSRLCEIADVALMCKALDLAEGDYLSARASDAGQACAWAGLAKVYERSNRAEALHALVLDAERHGIASSVLALPYARVLRSEGRLDEAQSVLASVPASTDPVGHAQLTGDIADRLGDVDAAFASFSAANDILATATRGSSAHAEIYRENFRSLTRLVTADWYAGWSPPPEPSARRAPLFIFGFPRSGTTLIDTMLSGHPDTVVFEEEPIIDRVAAAAGAIDHLGTISSREIERLRDVYFAEADRVEPAIGSRLIVDKQPLALGSTPILHRIFPDARFIFVERHPCDVVLSCFITSAQMDSKIANFFDFTGTAQLYDQVLAYWFACRETLAIDVLTARYERLIANPEQELRAIAEFAGLSWSPQMIDNRGNAAARSYIASPSYAQVSQPIYKRASGRWRRYERHMMPVMPILRPWIDRLGYAETPEA